MKTKRISIGFAILFAFLGCNCEKKAAVPIVLVGVWQTTAVKYANRAIEITEDFLIFERGGGYSDFVAYPIKQVEKRSEDGRTLFVITYTIPEGLDYKFSFYHAEENGGIIQLKNRNQIQWKKIKRN